MAFGKFPLLMRIRLQKLNIQMINFLICERHFLLVGLKDTTKDHSNNFYAQWMMTTKNRRKISLFEIKIIFGLGLTKHTIHDKPPKSK